MNEIITRPNQGHLTEIDADRITTSWSDLLRLPIRNEHERDQMQADIAVLSRPAPRRWLMARSAALLMSYYTPDVPTGAMQMEAEDWYDALKDFPQWAVTKACRWWKGAENPNRARRPREGDIAARCRFEMGHVALARGALRRFSEGVSTAPKDYVSKPRHKDRLTKERAAEIMREVGFRVNRFGQIDVAGVVSRIGAEHLSKSLGVAEDDISDAVSKNLFPTEWRDVIKIECNRIGIHCPKELFDFARDRSGVGE